MTMHKIIVHKWELYEKIDPEMLDKDELVELINSIIKKETDKEKVSELIRWFDVKWDTIVWGNKPIWVLNYKTTDIEISPFTSWKHDPKMFDRSLDDHWYKILPPQEQYV